MYNKSKFSDSRIFLNAPMSPTGAVDLTITNSVYFNTSHFPPHLSMSPVPVAPVTPVASVASVASVAPVTQNLYTTPWRPQAGKMYQCPVCGKLLSHRYTLKRHRATTCGKIRNTSGEFQCSTCKRRYDSKGSLSRHLRNECHVEPQFRCIFCEKKFTQKCSLFRHLKKKHEKKWE